MSFLNFPAGKKPRINGRPEIPSRTDCYEFNGLLQRARSACGRWAISFGSIAWGWAIASRQVRHKAVVGNGRARGFFYMRAGAAIRRSGQGLECIIARGLKHLVGIGGLGAPRPGPGTRHNKTRRFFFLVQRRQSVDLPKRGEPLEVRRPANKKPRLLGMREIDFSAFKYLNIK